MGNVDIVVDKLRVDKSRVRLAEVQVGDETGSISLRARDEQIDSLQKVSQEGGAIVLRNSSIELFQGKFLRLAVTKWGKISVYPDHVASTPDPPTTMNLEVDLSIVDLTCVPADMWMQRVSNSPPSDSATSQSHKPSTQSANPHQKQHYRGKGRGHDRRHSQQQSYQPQATMVPSRQDYGYKQMIGVTQGMPAPAASYAYPGTQYYSSYDDASIHSMQQKQSFEQQKQQISQQQLLYMQQQHFQLQRQMQQMERFLYNQSGTTMSQAPSDLVGDVHDLDAMNRAHMSTEQTESLQPHIDPHDISDNRSVSWSVTGDNMMTMEVPMSPQMNPHAASFAPHYPLPGKCYFHYKNYHNSQYNPHLFRLFVYKIWDQVCIKVNNNITCNHNNQTIQITSILPIILNLIIMMIGEMIRILQMNINRKKVVDLEGGLQRWYQPPLSLD